MQPGHKNQNKSKRETERDVHTAGQECISNSAIYLHLAGNTSKSSHIFCSQMKWVAFLPSYLSADHAALLLIQKDVEQRAPQTSADVLTAGTESLAPAGHRGQSCTQTQTGKSHLTWGAGARIWGGCLRRKREIRNRKMLCKHRLLCIVILKRSSV